MNKNIKVLNEYFFYKIENEKETKVAHAKNIILNAFSPSIYFGKYSMSCGSGTKEPESTDTRLVSSLFSSSSMERIEKHYTNDDKFVRTMRFTFPADSSHVGTISEIGLNYGNSLVTRALIRDVSGNAISINKTDTEILYIDLVQTFDYSASDFMRACFMYLIDPSTPSVSGDNWTSPIGTRYRLICGNVDKVGTHIIGNELGTDQTSYNNNIVTFPSLRFDVDNVVDMCLISGIAVHSAFGIQSSNWGRGIPSAPIGVVAFPNENVFQTKTLTSLRIGEGDGSTVNFVAPIPYWIKDTEKIYVNGVRKTRGTDYTCDNLAWSDTDPGLYPSSYIDVKNEVVYGTGFNNHNHPFKKNPFGSVVRFAWDKGHPTLEWELEDVGLSYEADRFVMGTVKTSVNGNFNGTTFLLEYSSNGSTWTIVSEYTYTGNSNAFSHTFEFENRITAKYWRLTIDTSEASNAPSGDWYYYMNSASDLCKLVRDPSPITFMTAPASGAVITMDADIDRPLKSSDYIIDFSFSISLSDSDS